MKALVLVGMPCSGKSTHAAKLAAQGWYIASTDAIIEREAQKQGITYTQGFDSLYKPAMLEMYEAIEEALKQGRNVCFDQTHLTVRSRATKLDLLPKTYICNAAVFYAPLAILQVRNGLRPGKVIPFTVMENMFASFKAPRIEEGFQSIYCQGL